MLNVDKIMVSYFHGSMIPEMKFVSHVLCYPIIQIIYFVLNYVLIFAQEEPYASISRAGDLLKVHQHQ